jgi:Protein of unknown function (DUF3592)
VGVLFIVLGTAMVIGVGPQYLIARGSVSWSQTQGRIVSPQPADDVPPVDQNLVRYEYEVNGRTLTGRRMAFGDNGWGWVWTPRREPSLGYKPDQAVTVYYDPGHPERCTLSRVVPHWWFTQVFVGAGVLILAGIGVLTGHIAVSG